ncbi:hypothetical protein Cgig2_010051 [Carnegiea gigantea]|uniref:Uncharacterized protein n=1 Tax=Carnegiea gigantea TaxID=171969 RepID=A0A9Q1K2V2_9CARY|nr:hypothetical protein Cgig2_010051 [Carnegiea gigantea]
MSLRGDAIRQAQANKAARPYRIRNAKAFQKFMQTPSLFPTTKKIERGRRPQTKNGNGSLFTPQSLLNKARQGDLGRSAGSFPVVLFPPRERRITEGRAPTSIGLTSRGHKALLKAEQGSSKLFVSSFRRVLFPVHWAVSLPSTCPLLLPPRAERSLSLLFSLLGPLPLLTP